MEAFIPLHPIAGQILDLYNTTDDDRPVFPLPVRDVLWYEVHGMGVALGMKENLSYHMARHSFGTLTLTAGIPIESIARIMAIRTSTAHRSTPRSPTGRYPRTWTG